MWEFFHDFHDNLSRLSLWFLPKFSRLFPPEFSRNISTVFREFRQVFIGNSYSILWKVSQKFSRNSSKILPRISTEFFKISQEILWGFFSKNSFGISLYISSYLYVYLSRISSDTRPGLPREFFQDFPGNAFASFLIRASGSSPRLFQKFLQWFQNFSKNSSWNS